MTVQYGEPMRWEPIENPTREQQQAVADQVLAEIRAPLRRAWRSTGRKGILGASRAERRAPSAARPPRPRARRRPGIRQDTRLDDVGAVIRRVWTIYVDQAPVLMPAAAVVFVFTGILSALLVAARARAGAARGR